MNLNADYFADLCEENFGYRPKTTFFMDFSIADGFGVAAIKDTYRRAKEEWTDNVEYMAELTMALNWKIWEHYEKNRRLAEVYNGLWEKCDAFCMEHFKGAELSKFFEITD